MTFVLHNKTQARKRKTYPEILGERLVELGCPQPTYEYKFHEERQWRLDIAWVDLKIAVEIDGSTYTGGRHTRGVGYDSDCIKKNHAIALGYKLFNFSSNQVCNGTAIIFLVNYFKSLGFDVELNIVGKRILKHQTNEES